MLNFKGLGQTVKSLVDNAGGPVAALINPHTMAVIGANIRNFASSLPPSPVVLGALSRIICDAIVVEVQSRPPSDRFMQMCRDSGKFDDDASIRSYRDLLMGEVM